jgi:hypothetical protein
MPARLTKILISLGINKWFELKNTGFRGYELSSGKVILKGIYKIGHLSVKSNYNPGSLRQLAIAGAKIRLYFTVRY